MNRNLNAPGEFDYDSSNDILFFKVKERNYEKSIELGDLVIDFDDEEFVVGLQIFNASIFMGLPKKVLINLKGFHLQSQILNQILTLRLTFVTMIRNKTTEYKPIIYQKIDDTIPNSELVCSLN
jgi:uncharacterized protein YuzE